MKKKILLFIHLNEILFFFCWNFVVNFFLKGRKRRRGLIGRVWHFFFLISFLQWPIQLGFSSLLLSKKNMCEWKFYFSSFISRLFMVIDHDLGRVQLSGMPLWNASWLVPRLQRLRIWWPTQTVIHQEFLFIRSHLFDVRFYHLKEIGTKFGWPKNKQKYGQAFLLAISFLIFGGCAIRKI